KGVAAEELEAVGDEARQVRVRREVFRVDRRPRQPEVVRLHEHWRVAAAALRCGGQDPLTPREVQRLPRASGGKGANHVADERRVLIPDLEGGERTGGLAVEACDEIDVFEADRHIGDVADAGYGTVLKGLDDNVAHLLGLLLCADGADRYVRAACAHRPAGDFAHRLGDALTDVCDGERVLQQGGWTDFDGDLVIAHTGDDDVAHARQRLQVVAHAADNALHLALIPLTGVGERDGGKVRLQLLDDN